MKKSKKLGLIITLIIIATVSWLIFSSNSNSGSNKATTNNISQEFIPASVTHQELENFISENEIEITDHKKLLSEFYTKRFYGGLVDFEADTTKNPLTNKTNNQFRYYSSYFKGFRIEASTTTITTLEGNKTTLSHNTLNIKKIKSDLENLKDKKIVQIDELIKKYPNLKKTDYYKYDGKAFITNIVSSDIYKVVYSLEDKQTEYLINAIDGEIEQIISKIRFVDTQFRGDIKYKGDRSVPGIKYDNQFADEDGNANPSNNDTTVYSQGTTRVLRNGAVSTHQANANSSITDITDLNSNVWYQNLNLYWHTAKLDNILGIPDDMIAAINHPNPYPGGPNAYWDGNTINMFQPHGPFSDDVIYHEIGHGINQTVCNTRNGGNHEGIADVRAYIVDEDQDDIMGENFDFIVRRYDGQLKSIDEGMTEVHDLGEPIAGARITFGKLTDKDTLLSILEPTFSQCHDNTNCRRDSNNRGHCSNPDTRDYVYVRQFEYALELTEFEDPLCEKLVEAFRETGIAQHSDKEKNGIPYHDVNVCGAAILCDLGAKEDCDLEDESIHGICKDGEKTCIENADGGTEWSECEQITFPDDNQEICYEEDGIDENCDGFINCADESCNTGPGGIICEHSGDGETICNDGGDNDGDGYDEENPEGGTDCEDLDCDGVLVTGDDFDDYYCEFTTEQSCQDGSDNDADGHADCSDIEDCGVLVFIERSDDGGEICGTDSNQIVLTATGLSITGLARIEWQPGGETERSIDIEVTETVVYTATIANLNGCTGTQSITIEYRDPTPEICDGGFDEDCDDLIDCDDLDSCEEDCRSCRDAGFDCSDPACQDMSYCDDTENNCCDGFDNDDDGDIDCDDPDCQGKPGCPLNGTLGGLGISPHAFQNFQQTANPIVEGAVYVDFKKNAPENFEKKIKEVFEVTKISQPFMELNMKTVRIDFNKEKHTNSQLINYITENFKKQKPETTQVPLFTVSNFVSNDTLVDDQRYLDYINIKDFELCENSKKKTTIAIVDNGFELDHEDLDINKIKSYDIADHDNDVSIPRALSERNHGTIARGIISAVTNNNKGIAGIKSDRSDTILIKATKDEGRGTDVTAGIDGLVKAAEMGADIINISRGTFEEIPLLKKVVKKLKKKGIILVASAGNYSSTTPFYPAAYEEVIAVGAHDQNGGQAHFSNYGNWVDVFAPGTNITTTNIKNNYISIDGTSEAAPIAAAMIAQAKAYGIDTEKLYETKGEYKILNAANICENKTAKTDDKQSKNVIPLIIFVALLASAGIFVFKKAFKNKNDDEF